MNTPVGFGQEPWDGFVVKLDLTRTGAASRVYTTFTGGNSFDDLKDMAVDSQGRVVDEIPFGTTADGMANDLGLLLTTQGTTAP